MWRTVKEPNHEEIKVKYLNGGHVAVVSLNRPKKFNAITFEMFDMLKEVMDYLGRNGSEVRAIVLTGEGAHFTSGLDLTSAMQMQSLRGDGSDKDPARAALQFAQVVAPLQQAVSSLEHCRVPVITAINGFCIGAGVDISSASDIRIASKEAKFSIKEVDLALAADIGTL